MEHVKLREKIGYGLGDAASSMFWKLFTMYLLFFYTDVVGISAAVVGTMFLITRIWDTFLDPFIGILGDRTHSRFGKFRPYLLWGAIPFGYLTMQLLNHSRAASGAEHLMAHLVEMKPPRFENAHGMHGQCVGVGTYLCAKEYHYLASLPTPKAKPFEPLSRAWVDEKFGPLADGIMKENENDVLGTFDAQNIVDHWDEIRAIIAEIPSAEELAALCEKLGAFYKPEQIGIDPALSEDMLSVSAAIRNRLTLIRMRRVLDFGE